MVSPERKEAVDNTTNAVAGAGLFLPFWVGLLHDVSAGAALLVPILSAFWLLLQITNAALKWRRRTKAG